MPGTQSPSHVRAFVAAELPRELLDNVRLAVERLKAAAGGSAVRWTRPEQVHLTMKFLGNIPLMDLEGLTSAVGRAVTGFAPFRLCIRGLGSFPSEQRPRVIWLGLQGDLDTLARLQAELEKETGRFGSHSEDRPFHPHITIGRVKALGPNVRQLGEALRSESTVELGEWQLQTVTVLQSQLNPEGSIHSRLAQIALSGRC